MITFTTGNLFLSSAEALVNTVNTVGTMGKGIALQFKDLFPHNFKVYAENCRNENVRIGQMLVVKDSNPEYGDKIIINFPTKKHWRQPSKYEYILEGLKDLRRVIIENNIHDIAIPPLGCGNGGLDWERVKTLIENELDNLPNVNVLVYQPNLGSSVQQEIIHKNATLNPARAMLLYAMFYYETLGENCSLFVANKLVYLLQILGESSFGKLKFKPHYYGPYCPQVGYMLREVNGTYIRGLEQMMPKPFDPIELQYDKKQEVSDYIHTRLDDEQVLRLKRLVKLIAGYQSALSLEILASVAFIRYNNPEIGLEQTITDIQSWSPRKKHLFKEKYIDIAYQHLNSIFVSGATC